MGGEFAQSAQEFIFLRESFFLELLEALDGSLFRTELFEFDAVVIPIEFFAEVANSADQFALAGIAERQALAALKNHFGHAAGFRSLDAGESFACGRWAGVAAEVQIDERFIDLQAIFDEGDLEFLGVQAAAERFERFARFLKGGVSSGAIAARLRNLAAEKVGLVGEDGRLNAGDFCDGGVGFRLRGGELAYL